MTTASAALTLMLLMDPLGNLPVFTAVFFGALYFAFNAGMFPEGTEFSVVQKGWGVPTATDIALAWLVSRTVFGSNSTQSAR